MHIPFIWSGTEDEFRALTPASLWGPWKFTQIGSAFVGVFDAPNENIRDHTNAKLTFLPSHGSNALSSAQATACVPLSGSSPNGVALSLNAVSVGDTALSVITKAYNASGASFLNPDRF